MSGAITSQIDVAQVVLYAFWVFAFILVLHLRREDRREGYPLIREPHGEAENPGYLSFPYPKVFRWFHGGTSSAPNSNIAQPPFKAIQTDPIPGAPYVPTGNPMLAGVGPGAYALRTDAPDLTVEGLPRIVPLRVANTFHLDRRDPDPRGMSVVGGDGVEGGIVRDAWVDRSESLLRYLEVEVLGTGRRVLLPMGFAVIEGKRGIVRVRSILGSQFASVPALSNPERITLLEEERVMAYFGSGILYATPERQEPFL